MIADRDTCIDHGDPVNDCRSLGPNRDRLWERTSEMDILVLDRHG